MTAFVASFRRLASCTLSIRIFLILAALLVGFGTDASAQNTYYWNTTTTGNWSVSTNWDLSTGGSTGGYVTGTTTSELGPIQLHRNQQHRNTGKVWRGGFDRRDNLREHRDHPSPKQQHYRGGPDHRFGWHLYRFGSGAVTLGSLTNVMNIVIGASQTWTNSSANPLTVVNGISGAGMTLSLAGNVTLNGTISTTLSLNVSSGTVSFLQAATASRGQPRWPGAR